jgi:hypothetical protein
MCFKIEILSYTIYEPTIENPNQLMLKSSESH